MVMSPQNALNNSLNQSSFTHVPKRKNSRKPSVRKNRKTPQIYAAHDTSNMDIVSDMPDDPRFMMQQYQNNYMDVIRKENQRSRKGIPPSKGTKSGAGTRMNPSLLKLDASDLVDSQTFSQTQVYKAAAASGASGKKKLRLKH